MIAKTPNFRWFGKLEQGFLKGNAIDCITPIRYPNSAEATVIVNGNNTFKGITGGQADYGILESGGPCLELQESSSEPVQLFQVQNSNNRIK